MRTSFALLLIVTLLLTSYIPSTTGQNARSAGITCPKQSDFPNCMCDTYSFHYPKMNPILRVELMPNGEELDVICHNGFSDFADLPNLQVGNINIMNMKECKMLADKSLLETIRFVGVNSTRQMYYRNWNNKIPFTAMFFEGLQDLEQLVLDEGVEHIESDAFSNLTHLQRLDIRFIDPPILQPGIFDGLVSLSNLSLDRNGISKLESGIFQNLKKLQKLDLGDNKLREISKSTFKGLQNLKHLYLFYNKIESLSADAFSLLPNLTTLELSFNPLNIISGNFTVNRKLKTFILTDNEAPLVLSDYLLSHLPELETVDLHDSKLNQLPENLFHESKAIVTLDLSKNGLKSLPILLLHDQSDLVKLTLSSNQLISVSGNVFATLSKLKLLFLDNNNLHFIDDTTFKGTTSLEQLYLQNNRLSFDGINFASENCLVFNVSKHSPLQYLENLRVLNLRNNGITSIFPDWQENIFNLNELDLSYNAISRLSGKFDLNFSSEINVDLSHNRISHISELNLSQDLSRVKVSLKGNPLNCDCDLMEFLQYTRVKNKSHIDFITDELRCSEPQELIGDFNALQPNNLTCTLMGDKTGCPLKCNCINRPADLTIVVNCTGQELTEIWPLPRPSLVNYSFIELHIENNSFKELPSLRLSGYEKVIELHARNNSIDKVSVTNFPTHLRLLDLRYNKLTTLDKEVLDIFNQSTYLTNLQLSSNRWTCDCSNKDFVLFVQENHRNLSSDKSLIICEDGRRVDLLPVDELCDGKAELNENIQSKGNTLNVLFVVLGCSGLLLGILSAFYYYYQIEIKVWLFTHKLFLWFITEEELDKDKQYDAFISYSHKDALFIEQELVPWMETQMNFKICIHERDWIPGEMIPEQIINSVENSRRTVIVLSKHYLESSWAQLEFRTAHLQSLAEKRIRVIIIMFGDIGDVDSLDAELKAYLKMNTYVKHEDPWFWDKLRYAMPHPVTAAELKKQRRKRNGAQEAANFESRNMLEPECPYQQIYLAQPELFS